MPKEFYQSDPLGTLKTLASFGDVISFQLAGQNMVLVNRSELIQEVLVNQAKCFGHAKGLHRMRFDLGEGLLTSAGGLSSASPHVSARFSVPKNKGLRKASAWHCARNNCVIAHAGNHQPL